MGNSCKSTIVCSVLTFGKSHNELRHLERTGRPGGASQLRCCRFPASTNEDIFEGSAGTSRTAHLGAGPEVLHSRTFHCVHIVSLSTNVRVDAHRRGLRGNGQSIGAEKVARVLFQVAGGGQCPDCGFESWTDDRLGLDLVAGSALGEIAP